MHNAQNYRAILKFIDDNYLGAKTTSDAIVELINYCSNNNEVWKRLITISSTTLAVGISCYFLQAFTPILQWYQSFMDIIPSWLVIAQDKVIITIKK